jgi:hypothetical protein
LVAFGAGVVLVVAALLVYLVASAGIEPVWRCLVVFPLVSYRSAHSAARWGTDLTGGGRFPLSRQLKYLPLVMLPAMIALLVLWLRRRGQDAVRALTLLTVFGAGSIGSILYYPDSIHIAFIAPVFLVATAVLLDWTFQLLPASANRILGAATGAAVLACGGLALYAQLIVQRVMSPVQYESAFGEVALDGDAQATVWDQLRPLIEADPSHLVHFYPIPGYAYLLSGAKNPTRFSLIVPGAYTPPEQVQEILHDLSSKRVRYIVAAPGVTKAGGPIAAFIREHYHPAAQPYPLSRFLWLRTDTPADAGPSGPEDRGDGGRQANSAP